MKSTQTIRWFSLLIALFLISAVATPSWGALGYPGQEAVKGVVQEIDYVHHAITVDGKTYAVAPNAGFKGIGGFSVLHVGMPIAYTLGVPPTNATAAANDPTPPANAQPVITHITWLPGGA